MYKTNFLDINQQYMEVCCADSAELDNGFQDINPDEEDIWLIQCPKGIGLTQLQGHKIKLPGRTNIYDFEVVAVEVDNSKIEAFGFCNRKGRYGVCTLPIKGNIVYRERLKAMGALSIEQMESLHSLTKAIPMPNVKVRHPLLGAEYEECLKLDTKIVNSLKKAGEESVQITRDVLRNNNKEKCKELKNFKKACTMPKKNDKKGKRKPDIRTDDKESKKKSKNLDKEDEDLQWIKKL